MERLVYVCCCLCAATAQCLKAADSFKAHRLEISPFNEQWFYNLSDPDVGLFKVSLQTYATASDSTLRSYVHFAFSDKNGRLSSYDYFFSEVELSFLDDHQPFFYKVGDQVLATENGIELHTDEVDFSFQYTGSHRPYWSEDRRDRSPFGWLGELPSSDARWFIYTLGTPAHYQLRLHDTVSNHRKRSFYQGNAQALIDKGWFTAPSRGGYAYAMGLDHTASLMFAGGQLENLPLELWAGRYTSVDHNLVFRAAVENLTMKRHIDACKGELRVEMVNLNRKINFLAKAPVNSFQVFDYPYQRVFNDDTLITKSMSAAIDVQLTLFDEVKETHQFFKGLLEFSGQFICPELVAEK